MLDWVGFGVIGSGARPMKPVRRHRLAEISLAAFVAIALPARAGIINITDIDPPSPQTCTLAQAIATANSVNNANIVGASIGSGTSNLGTCNTTPSIPTAGANTLLVKVPAITLTTIDNYWYGPNALPPVASDITIVPFNGVLTLSASHVGDPNPATANAFRFFYVSGGLTGELPGGSLTLVNTILQGGVAKGGDSGSGGGGAGMGGAIFNQGAVALTNVSLLDNSATGGSVNIFISSANAGGGGIGQDGSFDTGGGFGGSIGSGWGGSGSAGNANGAGGGGGGFTTDSSAIASLDTNGAAGGGSSGLGGSGGFYHPPGNPTGQGGAAGDGGGGGGGNNGVGGGGFGGAFSLGGGRCNSGCGGGGGGVGGGGGDNGGGGGFGGGGSGGGGPSNGGFGGGHGYNGSLSPRLPGFGGGYTAGSNGTGGAGMGGALFNHGGAIALVNVTAFGNLARGGTGNPNCSPACNGSGLGAAIFNLNGSVTIDFSTLAGNFLVGNNILANDKGSEDGTVYSLAYGNAIVGGGATAASLTINDSIVHGTHADGGAGNDVLVNIVDGAHANSSGVIYKGKNFVQFSANIGSVTQTGNSPTQADPLLGSPSYYRASPVLLPVAPIGSNSLAHNAAPSCLQANNAPVGIDARGADRNDGACDVGAYEFDGDYIFANSIEPSL